MIHKIPFDPTHKINLRVSRFRQDSDRCAASMLDETTGRSSYLIVDGQQGDGLFKILLPLESKGPKRVPISYLSVRAVPWVL